MTEIDSIIARLRVPDLPYPVGSKADDGEPAWADVLASCWSEQVDSTVVQLLRDREDRWSSRQVNAAYLTDRIMDVFLRTSGLHFSLVQRVARLRFYLAWRLHREGESAVVGPTPLRLWLDHLTTWQGWNDGEGRSARRLLQRIDDLVPVVAAEFIRDSAGLADYVTHWLAEDARQEEKASRLRSRLLETERGAARQRAADLYSSHRVARVLDGRRLPKPIVQLIDDQWQVLLRQIALTRGLDSEPWKQAVRAMEWLVWAMDPTLSDSDRDRLYQVGEELPERVTSIWRDTFTEPLPAAIDEPLQKHLVARLRGEALEFLPVGRREHDPYWSQPPVLPEAVAERIGQWLVSGKGATEQRRWLFAYFETSGEVLWTNGQGVKLGLEPARSVAAALQDGTLQPLPEPQPFEKVLTNTVTGLGRVLDAQQKQRRLAVERARQEAEALRREREAAERQAQTEVRARAEREAEAEQVQRRREEAQRLQERESHKQELLALIDQMHLGSWIETLQNAAALKLKLAVRINATGKLVFVDRLGLNKREINRQDLAEMLLEEQARILSKGAEFEDTLSRVVGRIRVGR